MKTMKRLAICVFPALFLTSCSITDSNSPRLQERLQQSTKSEASRATTAFAATIHRTKGGVPHIIAEDWGGIGFGTGYAAAQDLFCELARNVLKYRAQQSQYLGPDGGNLNTDLFYQYLIDTGIYDVDISPELEAEFAGYAAGFNRYLRDTGVDNLPDAACRGADWIQPMTALDVKRVHLTPAFLPRLSTLFLAATPPVTATPMPTPTASNKNTFKQGELSVGQIIKGGPANRVPKISNEEMLALVADIEAMATASDKGSNGVAIGSDLTEHSGGILYANPHLDWDLSFRFFPRHHIIPGVTNELGANTWERSNVGFGTNGRIAWTNTVSTARNQALYELDLVPGNPLAYIYDGEQRDLTATAVSVNVLNNDGSLSVENHTFYESHHGLLLGQVFAWTESKAFALRIANEGARASQGAAIAFMRSNNVREFKDVLAQYQPTASTNSIAADSSGEAFYGDFSPNAGFTDQQLTECATTTSVAISFLAPAFSGNSSACEWNTDSDSAAPGLLGASQQAFIFRRDYATNSNSSFWLANPNVPITGVPMVQGDVETERSLRTRSGLRMIQERIDGTDGLVGNTFNIDTALAQFLGNQNEAGILLRDDLLTLCADNPKVMLNGAVVNISAACPVLAAWDLRSNKDSRGAHLFREFMRAASGGGRSRTLPASLNYRVPFDVNDAVNTPRGLNIIENPNALLALAKAVRVLNDAGIALDAQLGELQSVTRNQSRIPLHGGEEFEGVFNKMHFDFAGADGYPDVTGSSGSWIMAVEFTPDGPVAKGILTYSISTNPDSPHNTDMTEMFSRKEFVDLPFSKEDVEAAALSTMTLSEGTAQCEESGWQHFTTQGFADEAACRIYFVDVAANRLTDFVD